MTGAVRTQGQEETETVTIKNIEQTENRNISEQVMLGVTAREESSEEGGAQDIAASLSEARRVAAAIDDKQGADIVVLDISKQSSFADFFVNATAGNVRMLATIQDAIDKALAQGGYAIRGTEGKPESGWVLVDCGDVVVNLFLAEQRAQYQIEKVWSDATILEWREN
jgi:ribosome-associated protein